MAVGHRVRGKTGQNRSNGSGRAARLETDAPEERTVPRVGGLEALTAHLRRGPLVEPLVWKREVWWKQGRSLH
jgi:hypothetical protein